MLYCALRVARICGVPASATTWRHEDDRSIFHQCALCLRAGYREAVVVRKNALMLSSILNRKLILVCRVQHGGSAKCRCHAQIDHGSTGCQWAAQRPQTCLVFRDDIKKSMFRRRDDDWDENNSACREHREPLVVHDHGQEAIRSVCKVIDTRRSDS